MTLVELNKIEQVLKENRDAKSKARRLFNETMRKKYDKDDWFRDKMNNAEKETYGTLYEEYNEAANIYKSFVEHNWR